MQLRYTDRCRLSHIRIAVPTTPPHGVHQILRHRLQTDVAHGAHGQRANQRVRIQRILAKRVHRQDRQVRLRLRVVHDIQIHKLLRVDRIRLHTIYHVRKQRTHVFTHTHRSYHLFHCLNRQSGSNLLDTYLPLPVATRGVQFFPEFNELPSFACLKILSIGGHFHC